MLLGFVYCTDDVVVVGCDGCCVAGLDYLWLVLLDVGSLVPMVAKLLWVTLLVVCYCLRVVMGVGLIVLAEVCVGDALVVVAASGGLV